MKMSEQEQNEEVEVAEKQEDSAPDEQEKKGFSRFVLELVVAILFYMSVCAALTWPAILNLESVLLGGGELGGWLWRHWWHFSEVDAIQQSEMGALSGMEALISLGRYPETGNILDILLFSYPLRNWFGFPADHNLKILLILLGNGLCGSLYRA